MTEQEWLESTDPQKMLDLLRGKASDRKLRLFAAACCRRIWPLLTDQRSREAVEVVERYADGLARKKELNAVLRAAAAVWDEPVISEEAFGSAATAAVCAADQNAYSAAVGMLESAVVAASLANPNRPKLTMPKFDWEQFEESKAKIMAYGTVVYAEAHEACCNVLRCIFGNPFRTVAINAAWLAWNDGTVQKIAQSIYDERAFDRMPILADALEEAGCQDQDFLTHCRQPGEHVRGCWAVDAVLGKK